MTKQGLRLALPATLVLLLSLMAPGATAHGAPATREIDTRVIADGTDNGDYGLSGQLDEGAHDLLALDVREAYNADGEPALYVRFIVQGGNPAEGPLTDTLHLTVNGTEREFSFSTNDNSNVTSHDFDAFVGFTPIGDGHPKCYEFLLSYKSLGVKAGDTISGIRMVSKVAEKQGDFAPGSWMYNGVEVPAPPTASSDPADLTLEGPAQLLNVSGPAAPLKFTPGKPATARITVTNPLTVFQQFVSVGVEGTGGVGASSSLPTFLMEPNGTQDLDITLFSAQTVSDPTLKLIFWTDLYSKVEHSIPLEVLPPEPSPTPSTPTSAPVTPTSNSVTPTSESAVETSGTTSSKGTPGPGLVVAAAATLAGLAVARRRFA